MMKSAVAVNNDGMIVKVFSWASEELIADNVTPDDTVLYVDAPTDRSSYWDFSSEAWINLTAKPSFHHNFDYGTKTWNDTWAYDDYLAQALRKAKSDADSVRLGGFLFSGKLIQSDNKSQMSIGSMLVTDSIDWITADNSIITLSAEGFTELKRALSDHIQTTRSTYNELKRALPSYTITQLKEYINEN